MGDILEVGTNGAGEVVINHPDLQPDENGTHPRSVGLDARHSIVVPTPQTPTPPPARPPATNASVFKAPPPSQMRSYSWALSGDFNAKMDLFGEAKTEEDIDALADYVEITIKALKRSLKARTGEAS
jgi:hypothetical protein